ncbi:hypothetical protein PInf_018695 [Phytophthora infestans]|nr:hypothetical protein PInf_018695 [Phytophthora infestans]
MGWLIPLYGTGASKNRKRGKKREKEDKRFMWPDELAKFAFQTSTLPIIYFGVSTRLMTTDDLDELLRKIDAAATTPASQVRIIFQTRESANVLQIASGVHYTRLFLEENVFAAIHWGEPDITAEALSAGKPNFTACVCQQAQVGLPLIDWKTCTGSPSTRYPREGKEIVHHFRSRETC